MNSFQKILRTHGSIKVNDETWVWDYKNECPRKESQMTKVEIKANRKHHKEKGILILIGRDKIEWG